MFEEIDPKLFVGKGLALEQGVGKGNGRKKKTPPAELGDYFDESVNKFRRRGTPALPMEPINRGPPSKFVQMMSDGRAAKQRMITCNMRLVVTIAKKYAGIGVGIQDLCQEGSLGLHRAAEKFEPKRNFKFSTYASWWIQQAVFKSLAADSRTIRLPVHVHNLLNQVRRTKRELQTQLSREPSAVETADALGMSVGRYQKMLRFSRKVLSLDMPAYSQNPKNLNQESVDLLGDTIDNTYAPSASTEFDDPETRLDRSFFREDMRKLLLCLPEHERLVITMRYGVEDGNMKPVSSIAAQLGQSRAWVRSTEAKALRKLRRPWYEERLREHQESLA